MNFLICPKCKSKLILTDNKKSYVCNNNHLYDVSKHGYVNLLLSKTNCGDNYDSVKARENFLDKGYYNLLACTIDNIINTYNKTNILDLGCGVGYYSKKLGEKHQITGVDISKDAIMLASKRDKCSNYLVCSSSFIPVSTHYFDCAYAIFAPVFEDELSRVLNDDGILILVSKNKNHLIELKNILYDEPYYNPDKLTNFSSFKIVEEKYLSYQVSLDHQDILNLVLMTPYQYKTKKEDLNRLNLLNNLCITIDFKITVYKKSHN